MAANPPYEGAVLVLGTVDEVGVPLLEKADDPQDVVAYAGYGFWAPAALVRKVKGLKAEDDVKVGPVAPVHSDQAVQIPALDGQVADEHPQGDAEPAPAPAVPETPTENDPTATVGVAEKAPSKVAAEKPVANTAAAE